MSNRAKPNNFTNPKGYALFVGINEFSNPGNNLSHCVDDVNYWKNEFELKYDYDKINSLINDQATLENFMCAIWSLAARTLPGDVVTITISTHGLMNDKKNSLLLYNQKINENQFHFLLKAFKPHVRIFMITDACQSGTWIEQRNRTILPGELKQMKDLLKTTFPNSHTDLDKLFENQEKSDVVALVNHLASANDYTNVPDGILTKFNEKVPLHLEYLNIVDYRDLLNACFKSAYDLSEAVKEAYDMLHRYSKTYDAIYQDYKNTDFYFFKSYFTEKFKSQKTMFLTIHAIESSRDNFMSDKKLKDFDQSVGFLKSHYQYHFGTNPVVNFTGLSSSIFLNSKLFKKYNAQFASTYKPLYD